MEGFPREVLCIEGGGNSDTKQYVTKGTIYTAVDLKSHPIKESIKGYQLAEIPYVPPYGNTYFETDLFVDLSSDIDEMELVNEEFKEKTLTLCR